MRTSASPAPDRAIESQEATRPAAGRMRLLGWSVRRELWQNRPILIVSAYQPPPRTQLEKLKAHFMPKPFDFAAIVHKIQELLG